MQPSSTATAVQQTSIEITRDVVYATPGGFELKADIYAPRNPSGPRAAIIWLHGGGWRFGNRRLAPDLSRYYAERGYVMVSIDYRLSGVAIFPAALEDVKTAIRWLKSVATQYNIDANRIALWGASAGGHLAALATTTGIGQFEGSEYLDYDSSIAAIVDAYGPSDFSQMDAHRDPEGKPSDDIESIQLPAGKLTADADSLESLFLGAPIADIPEKVRAANPIAYMSGDLPPFLLLHGSSDTAVPVHQSELLYEALAAYGNEVTFGLIQGLGHGFTNRKHLDQQTFAIELHSSINRANVVEQVTRPVFELIGDWLDRRLRNSQL